MTFLFSIYVAIKKYSLFKVEMEYFSYYIVFIKYFIILGFCKKMFKYNFNYKSV